MMKNEKGAITLYVVTICLFIVLVGIAAYVATANKQSSQLQQLGQMEGKYKGSITQEELYNGYVGGDIIPIYTAEQLLKMGTGEEVYIDGKIYDMEPSKTYVLKANLESNSEFANKVTMVEDGNGVIIKEY